MMKIKEIDLIQVKVPLTVPYVVSTRTITDFDPILVCARDQEGREGWGEALIAPGYTYETLDGAWSFCETAASLICGEQLDKARSIVSEKLATSPGAASALLAAMDMLQNVSVLNPKEDIQIPLLAPLQGHSPSEIEEQVEKLIEQGFKTLKVKVGFNWEDDLHRVELVQQAIRGRTTIRLDANRSFKVDDAIKFAQKLQPEGIELFEQPCGSDAWDDNAAVAAKSNVAVMLDESIYNMDDVRRAAAIDGVKFIKLKLKKIGSVQMLCDALDEIRNLGVEPVLGDGTALEIGCWMEACVAAQKINNAGEMNGFLKTTDRLFKDPLTFAEGCMLIPANYQPEIDHDVVRFYTQRVKRFSKE